MRAAHAARIMDNVSMEATPVPPSALFTISGASFFSGLWAMVDQNPQIPSVLMALGGITLGTFTFLYGIRNAVENKRYQTLMDRYGEDSVRHKKEVDEYEKTIGELKDKFDVIDDERRALRHSVKNLQHEIALMKTLAEETKKLADQSKCPFAEGGTALCAGMDKPPEWAGCGHCGLAQSTEVVSPGS